MRLSLSRQRYQAARRYLRSTFQMRTSERVAAAILLPSGDQATAAVGAVDPQGAVGGPGYAVDRAVVPGEGCGRLAACDVPHPHHVLGGRSQAFAVERPGHGADRAGCPRQGAGGLPVVGVPQLKRLATRCEALAV